MAIFTAGCLNLTSDIKKIRTQAYRFARRDLDSVAIKISLRKHANGINYIAFLPKEKLIYENILSLASKNRGKSVIIFELDYKNVGVVLEDQKIVDYILEKPEEFALERGYNTLHANNAQGELLVSLNLDHDKKETWVGSALLISTILITTGIFYMGFNYLNATELNLTNRDALVGEYKQLVQANVQTSFAMTKKVDLAHELNKIEEITQASNSTLQKISYQDNKLCVEIATENLNVLLSVLPPETKITKEDATPGIVRYCNEKI